jgi:hypothetical protein
LKIISRKKNGKEGEMSDVGGQIQDTFLIK